jgi:hypothetical protein
MAPGHTTSWDTNTTYGGSCGVVYYSATSSDDWYNHGPAVESKLKKSRKAWLVFTRGRGWTEPEEPKFRLAVSAPPRQATRPGPRLARRRPHTVRRHTLKQLRRLGVI